MTEWQKTHDELIFIGYEQKDPPEFIATVDRARVNKWHCSYCGHNGLDYVPFMRGASYRKFSVCPNCGHFEEQ